MQKNVRQDGAGAGAGYRERLSPSLWVLGAAGVVAPMAGLVVAPIAEAGALTVGILVGVLVIAGLVALSPVVEVRDGMLRAGPARIPVELLGDPVARTGEEARHARGPGLDPRGWYLIRGSIDGLVVVPVLDPEDPAPSWTVSTRTPDRLAAAVRRAQDATRRTPSR